MPTQQRTRFVVLDAMPAPHGGQILRLRLEAGDAPSLRTLKGTTLEAVSPRGERASVQVLGFALFGGKASDRRLARTGRVDVHVKPVDPSGDAEPVGLRWEIEL